MNTIVKSIPFVSETYLDEENPKEGMSMKPHQVVTGAANSCPDSFSCLQYLGFDMLAYVKGNNIVLFSGKHFIQILSGHKEDVISLAWCKSFGKLVSCSKNRMVLYEPEELNIDLEKEPPTIKFSWRVSYSIDLPNFAISSVSIGRVGDKILVAGGKEILLFELNKDNVWVKAWKIPNANPVCPP